MRGLLNQLVNSVNFGESTTLLSFKDDGLYDLVSKLVDNKEVYERFQKATKNNIIVRKLSVRLMERMCEEDDEKGLLDYLGLNVHDKDEFLKLLEGGNSVVFLIEEIDKLKNPAKIVDTFDQLLKKYHDIHFIYLLEDAKVFLDLQSELEPNSSFFENTIIMGLEVEQEKEYLQNMCKEKYGALKNKSKLADIYKQSSGHYELYKRLYKSEITGNYDSFENYARRLIKSFGDKTLQIFRKVVNKVELSDSEEEIIRIYRDLGFVKKNKISIPVLEQFIQDLTPKENIMLNEDGQIIFSNIQQFSKTEIKVLKTFLENEGEIVTKEELGFVVWGTKVDQKYSPWAIDQIIFRIRLKLDKLNLDGEVKTIHGKGYVFQGKDFA